jgi:hypothetical protein
LEIGETRDVAAWSGKLANEATADRIGNRHAVTKFEFDTIRSGASASNSFANSRMRTGSPAPKRTSIRRLLGSVQPNF